MSFCTGNSAQRKPAWRSGDFAANSAQNRERRGRGRRNGLYWPYFSVEWVRMAILKGGHCKLMKQLITDTRMGLKASIIWQIYADKFWCSLVFDVLMLWMFKLYLNSFIQRCPYVTLWGSDVFHSLFKNYFPALRSFRWLGWVTWNFWKWIFLKGHRQACRHHSSLKYG